MPCSVVGGPGTVLHVTCSCTCDDDASDFPQAFGVFGLCQIHAFLDYIRSKLSRAQFDTLFWSFIVSVSSAAVVVGGTLTFLGSE